MRFIVVGLRTPWAADTAVVFRPMMTTGTVFFIAGLIRIYFQATICFGAFRRQYSRLAKLAMPRRIYKY